MKKLTFLLAALMACFALQANAQQKAPMRSAIFDDSNLPSEYEQIGETSLYYDITERYAAGAGYQYGISILGKIVEMEDGEEVNHYYSSTYESGGVYGPGAGFIAAFKVDNNSAHYLNAEYGSTYDNVTMTARVEPQGTVAARIVYSLTNNNTNGDTVTVSAGVWGDIMIGDNDNAPLSKLTSSTGYAYGIKMKYRNTDDSPLLCALFGDGVTGVTARDDYWFGYYRSNYTANAICGNYDTNISYYMVENSNAYDSGLGFCWKDRKIAPGETIELSYVISVGEVEFDEPDDPIGQDIFTYQVEALNIGEDWNNLNVEHPAHIWGHYEHPYGQEAYIEYSVDGGEWTRIETPLTSGEDYDLPFMMEFNSDITDLHTLELRFTLGMGNYTDLDGLEWEDVRSIDLSVAPGEHVYNGEPQIFNVTVGGVIDYTLGENGEYINAGEYPWGIYGVYEMNTIGVNEVILFVDKAASAVTVDPLEDVEWDGNPHGANVTVIAGDGELTVTYIKVGTDIVLTEAPTDEGVYMVVVNVAGTNNYYGYENSYGPYEIYGTTTGVEELTINTEGNGAWYTIDGRRVVAPAQPGLYIHNGKKYIVK